MCLCAIHVIKIDCASSALFITLDNVNTVWTCVYLFRVFRANYVYAIDINKINVMPSERKYKLK